MKLYVIAGEDSGDLHASNLIKEIKLLRPDATFRGVGGDLMEAQGTKLITHLSTINFMGFWEIITHLSVIRKLFRDVKADIAQWKPDAVILLDYPGFNLRIAKYIHSLGIKVFFYISPQVWAWKKGRVKTIRRYVDRLFVILPFEKDFYQKEGLDVSFVGHPLLDVVPLFEEKKKNKSRPLIALLPGSRKQEINRMLPVMLKLPALFPQCDFVIAGAPSQKESFYQRIIQDERISLQMGKTYDILARSDFGVITSGTATLEAALFHVPQVVCYKGSSISYHIGKRLVKIKYISLVNLILDTDAVTELIQYDYTINNIRKEIEEFLGNKRRQEYFQKIYTDLRVTLGHVGASKRTATEMLGFLEN